MEKLKDITNKRALAKKYKQKYGIRIDALLIERLTEKQLLIKLETRYQIIKERNAAIKIQSMARQFICIKLFRRLQNDRIKAATLIQKAWRKSCNKYDLVFIIKALKNLYATTIQRHMKGYRVSQQMLVKIRREKLQQNLEHFKGMR